MKTLKYRGTNIPPSKDINSSPMPNSNQSKIYQNNLFFNSEDAAMNKALHYLLYDRGLTKDTLIKYSVGMARFKFPTAVYKYTQHPSIFQSCFCL